VLFEAASLAASFFASLSDPSEGSVC
jgi:hypothetical protein